MAFEPDADGPDGWDTIFFAGVRCPGVARVSVRLATEIDERRQIEVKKSFIIDKGSKPVRVTVELTLLPKHLADFYSKIIPLLQPRSASKGQVPLAVSHPVLLMWGVEMLMVEDIDQKPMAPGAGLLELTISLVEYVEAPKTLKRSAPKTAIEEITIVGDQPITTIDVINDMLKR